MADHSAEKCCAIIAAAGRSTRMGGDSSKQFLPLLGVPAIVRTLWAFDRASEVGRVIVVCRGEDLEQMKGCIERYRVQKVTAVLRGGGTRQESVSIGVRAVPAAVGCVAVHDGARPLITPDEINACVGDAFRCGASALGTPLKDTVKKIDLSQCVLSTPARECLWAVQTPQVFHLDLYRQALAKAQADGKDYTDDCQLVEQIGIRVHLCRGSYENIKLTTEEDLAVAEAILKKREAGI
ncbi:2-C-methyl-D-erythritol 4-phosphate cytidylyltransferase [Caprobacter fermentans]|uniref:2-C-methyl-D-erythritol 4-phosphate cytidylyltransferase n=1 Tax=Caproicibacter fermentans TaxID=2576756 RepID=A0A6N8I355_9FIRM|nr:2-C-methyl-D-erythritol 4-phosphate cytidylyltransferase [Caproicibacter fermentans]MVB12378.1 2-C-methyl-D-erythritol 4-phosphate cytidylyltransferase [Caproicibacter fermentans]OCN03107.1 2-C-methyl-D-erythritol 4-phosphate cytidylyltransferase [Clostridium sp. W14A]QNK40610.1 2-C-methyl-D-erythritol 4-phosphate cytidylyltransferase [Caproicibacter fermentans]